MFGGIACFLVLILILGQADPSELYSIFYEESDSLSFPFLNVYHMMKSRDAEIPCQICAHYPTLSEIRRVSQNEILAEPILASASVDDISATFYYDSRLSTVINLDSDVENASLIIDIGYGAGRRTYNIWSSVISKGNTCMGHGAVICMDTIPKTTSEPEYSLSSVLADFTFPLRLSGAQGAEWLQELHWAVDIVHIDSSALESAGHGVSLLLAYFKTLRPLGMLVGNDYVTLKRVRRAVDTFVSVIASGIVELSLPGNGLWVIKHTGESHRAATAETLHSAFCRGDQSKGLERTATNSVDDRVAPMDGGVCPGMCFPCVDWTDICPGHRHCPRCPMQYTLSPDYISIINHLEDLIDKDLIDTLAQALTVALDRLVSSEELVGVYEMLLKIFQCYIVDVPQSRVMHLGRALSSDSHRLPLLGIDNSSLWYTFIIQLRFAQLHVPFNFPDYYNLQIPPTIFHWPLQMGALYPNRSFIIHTMAHINYTDVFEAAMVQGPRLLYGKVPEAVQGELTYRQDRLHHVYDFILVQALTGLLPKDFSQIVEYGGGSGDLSVACRLMGFDGVYFIYDMYHMLLSQRFFLRYSGYPAYFPRKNISVSREEEAKICSNTTYLISSHSFELDRVMCTERDILAKSIFVATFSLTESPLSDRLKALAHVDQFKYIYIRSTHFDVDGIQNAEYMWDLRDHLRTKGYFVCLIKGQDGRPEQYAIFTLLAIKDCQGSCSAAFEHRCSSDEVHKWTNMEVEV